MDISDRSCSAPVLSQGVKHSEADVLEVREEFGFEFGSDQTSEADDQPDSIDGFFPSAVQKKFARDSWWSRLAVASDHITQLCGETEGSREKTLVECLRSINSVAQSFETQSIPQLNQLTTDLSRLVTSSQTVLTGHGDQLCRNLAGCIPFLLTTVGFALFETLIPSETLFIVRIPLEVMLLMLIVRFFFAILQ